MCPRHPSCNVCDPRLPCDCYLHDIFDSASLNGNHIAANVQPEPVATAKTVAAFEADAQEADNTAEAGGEGLNQMDTEDGVDGEEAEEEGEGEYDEDSDSVSNNQQRSPQYEYLNVRYHNFVNEYRTSKLSWMKRCLCDQSTSEAMWLVNRRGPSRPIHLLRALLSNDDVSVLISACANVR